MGAKQEAIPQLVNADAANQQVSSLKESKEQRQRLLSTPKTVLPQV